MQLKENLYLLIPILSIWGKEYENKKIIHLNTIKFNWKTVITINILYY